LKLRAPYLVIQEKIMPIKLFSVHSLGVQASVSKGQSARYTQKLILLVVLSAAVAGTAEASILKSQRQQVTALVVEIQRADYEGDRLALKRLYQELEPFVDNKELGTKVRYWRGFAMWRRAINGFNDSVEAQELEQDLKSALTEFEAAIQREPAFVDARAAAGSSLGILMFLYSRKPELAPEFKDPTRMRESLQKVLTHVNQAEAAEPENPRVLWVLGPIRWRLPAQRGGGQDKAIETYLQGLRAAQGQKARKKDPLTPSWGEPELLMSLAYSNLNMTKPDLVAAEQYARSALALVPYWRYVRDILMPQIAAAKAKR
jgi:hypothetical protein